MYEFTHTDGPLYSVATRLDKYGLNPSLLWALLAAALSEDLRLDLLHGGEGPHVGDLLTGVFTNVGAGPGLARIHNVEETGGATHIHNPEDTVERPSACWS